MKERAQKCFEHVFSFFVLIFIFLVSCIHTSVCVIFFSIYFFLHVASFFRVYQFFFFLPSLFSGDVLHAEKMKNIEFTSLFM